MGGEREAVFRALLTAAEAYPEFEICMMQAQSEVLASFRIFDPWTKLRSPEAMKLGRDWFDLIAATLARGVSVTIFISDFDAVARPDTHRATWASTRALIAAAEVSGKPHLLRVVPSLHPARIGILPRLLLRFRMLRELREKAAELNDMPAGKRRRYLQETPMLRRMLVEEDGRMQLRRGLKLELVPATHHQKMAVFDGKLLYIGGLDLNERRFDTPQHDRPGPETWHDLQILVDGAAARDAHRHLQSFRSVTHGAPLPAAPALLRTISKARTMGHWAMSPRTVCHEIADAHDRDAAQAKHLIYLESQFFRDRRIARKLAAFARRNKHLTMILILPAAPEDVAFYNNNKSDARYGEYLQARSVKIIRKAFKDRLFIGSPGQQKSGGQGGRGAIGDAPLVYLHAKVSIFDEASAIVSSANLNGRSFYWDTEAGIRLTDTKHVEHLRRRCFEHWLGPDPGSEFYDISTAQKNWMMLARENAKSQPHARRGFLMPYPARPPARFGRNLPGVPDEMV